MVTPSFDTVTPRCSLTPADTPTTGSPGSADRTLMPRSKLAPYCGVTLTLGPHPLEAPTLHPPEANPRLPLTPAESLEGRFGVENGIPSNPSACWSPCQPSKQPGIGVQSPNGSLKLHTYRRILDCPPASVALPPPGASGLSTFGAGIRTEQARATAADSYIAFTQTPGKPPQTGVQPLAR